MLARFLEQIRQPSVEAIHPQYQAAIACLNEIARCHAFIDLRDEHGSRQVRSMILDVSPETGEFRIDQPFPPEVDTHLASGATFKVLARLAEGPVQFETTVTRREQDADGICYICKIPPAIDRNQRRQDFRLPVASADGVKAEIMDPQVENRATAEVVNLSAAGIRVRMPRQPQWNDPTHAAAQCRLDLNGQANIHCRIVMRSVEVDEEQPDYWILGASFAGLDRYQQRQLGGYIAHRQRQQLRGAA